MTSATVDMIDPQDISAIILAGGRGSRMGGVDKGLQNFKGLPLALHTLQRLQLGGGVGKLMINANRNLATYASFGPPVCQDDGLANYAGPLAGFLAGLARCQTPYLLTVPCDTPQLPLDLAQRLSAALVKQSAELATVSAPETDEDGQVQLHVQPVFCLLRVELLESLVRFTQAGGRKISAWTAQHAVALVPFDQAGDDPQAFFNANTLLDLQSLEARS
jgi:molybdopterin-guanine dinucleotide biosynthesis protein A